jgi:membrane-associated phospholipid phosphatase
VFAIVCTPAVGLAQTQVRNPPIVGPGDVATVAAALVLLPIPELTGINTDPVECVPCDPYTVNAFDRWVIGPPRPAAATASDVLRAGLTVFTWTDLANEGPRGHAGVMASFESLLWAESSVHLIKALVGRNRPVLYTEEGIEVAHVVSNQRSWPSGHSATAAAVATSYCLTLGDLADGGVDFRCWLAVAGAVGVGVFRMAAAKHFPTDVLSGWAVGVGTAFAVHTIKF